MQREGDEVVGSEGEESIERDLMSGDDDDDAEEDGDEDEEPKRASGRKDGIATWASVNPLH
jgi:hypothetical protein